MKFRLLQNLMSRATVSACAEEKDREQAIRSPRAAPARHPTTLLSPVALLQMFAKKLSLYKVACGPVGEAGDPRVLIWALPLARGSWLLCQTSLTSVSVVAD